MDDALKLIDYLPLSFRIESEEEYIKFLWDTFESNYNSEKFEFASLAYHLLYMSFISFSIWQIRVARKSEFKHALIGFQAESENKLLNAATPFMFYEQLKESQIFRFLKIIGCSNEQVGEFSKFVKRRNKIAHPSGWVFFNDQIIIDTEITEMLKEVNNIQIQMKPIILDVYKCFLENSADLDEREYADANDQIREVLIHQHYLSQKDIEMCFDFDITTVPMQEHSESIHELHSSLILRYKNRND